MHSFNGFLGGASNAVGLTGKEKSWTLGNAQRKKSNREKQMPMPRPRSVNSTFEKQGLNRGMGGAKAYATLNDRSFHETTATGHAYGRYGLT